MKAHFSKYDFENILYISQVFQNCSIFSADTCLSKNSQNFELAQKIKEYFDFSFSELLRNAREGTLAGKNHYRFKTKQNEADQSFEWALRKLKSKFKVIQAHYIDQTSGKNVAITKSGQHKVINDAPDIYQLTNEEQKMFLITNDISKEKFLNPFLSL